MQFKKRTPTDSIQSITLPARKRLGGFTLIELLVVIAIIAILAAVLLPVLHQAQLRGETAACIDHQKQLCTAWVMYETDNNDGCAGNKWQDEENWGQYKGKWTRTGAQVGAENWISGWMDPSGTSPNTDESASWGPGMNGDSDNTNQDLLIDPSYASLGDYTKNPNLFICPACQVKVDGVQGGPRVFQQVRSVSMNSFVGYVCSPSGNGGPPVYRTFGKSSAITAGMSPVDLFVFMEERGESIDDGSFAVFEDPPTAAEMFNWPTDYHNNCATIGFADGHVDTHRWFGTTCTDPTSKQVLSTTSPQESTVSVKFSAASVNNGSTTADLVWLNTHATIPVAN